MRTFIKVFIRKDDGERFTLNEDGVTYSMEAMKRDFPDSLHQKWGERHLSNKAFRYELIPATK